MSEKSIKVEVDKNGCSYVVLSLVSIEVILRLRRSLLGSRSTFWTTCLIKNRTKTAFSNFRRFPKKQESLKLVKMFFENSSLKGIGPGKNG